MLKKIKGTNISVKSLRPSTFSNQLSEHSTLRFESDPFNLQTQELLHSLKSDDPGEIRWLQSLRPEKCLTHPSEAFTQGIKKLRPAIHFNSYDGKLVRKQRLKRQKAQLAAYEARRKAQVVPTIGMKTALNPHKIPTDGQLAATSVKKRRKGKKEASASIVKKKSKIGRSL